MQLKAALHKTIYHIARFLVPPVLKVKYGFKTDKIPKLDEPYVMLSNHTTEIDMLFVGMASRRHKSSLVGTHQRGSNSICVLIVTLVTRLVNGFLHQGNAGHAMPNQRLDYLIYVHDPI